MVATTNVESTHLEVTAARLAALGDPTRLRIVAALRPGQRCVCDLRAQVNVPANLLSYHLKVLLEAGIITASRRGRWIDYSLVPDALEQVRRTLAEERPR